MECTDKSVNYAEKSSIFRNIINSLQFGQNTIHERDLEFYDKDGPLLMDGPTGTGKSATAELIARRQGKKIVKVNISAMTETTLESEMRGHAKGAFTGAIAKRDGWSADAHDGILLLDEFQNASLASQTQLLDLLDPVSNDVYIRKMGENHLVRYNVKVILALNKPVDELLATGKLREDLFYRIRDIIKMKPLNDILKNMENNGLVSAQIKRLFYLYRWKTSPYLYLPVSEAADSGRGFRISEISDLTSLFPEIEDSAIKPLKDFPWKGNYRQLERVISDIHWQSDKTNRDRINENVVAEHLGEERKRLGSDASPVCTDMIEGWNQTRLRTVETLLKQNRFNISLILVELKPLKLGSRATLRSFLKENYNNLSKEVQTDSAISKFLRIDELITAIDRPHALHNGPTVEREA